MSFFSKTRTLVFGLQDPGTVWLHWCAMPKRRRYSSTDTPQKSQFISEDVLERLRQRPLIQKRWLTHVG